MELTRFGGHPRSVKMSVEEVPYVQGARRSGPGACTRPSSRPRRCSSCEPGAAASAQVARELGLADSLVHAWVRQAEVDAGKGPAGALTTAEKEELSHLRREVKVLRMEREILKRAATFFAKESA